MNLRFLEAFVWAARLRSFRAAADRLGTTQAGLSSRIATLEQQLGARLFDREHRTVTLTFQGTSLLPLAERMLELQAQIPAVIGESANLSGTLRIGAIETIVHTWLPDLLSRFAQQFPNVTIELNCDITPRLREELLRGTIDCAIHTEEITSGFIVNHAISRFTMRWIASPNLALPAQRLGFADIARYPIISFHRESMVYRNIAINAAMCGPMRVSYFSSLAAMVDLTRAGFGIAPLPLAVVSKAISEGELVALDVEPALIPLPLFVSVRAEPPSPLSEAVARLARESCAAYVASAPPGIVAD